MAITRPRPGFVTKNKPPNEAMIRERFQSDCARVAELTDGGVSLSDIVDFVHSSRFRLGAAGWNCDGTVGLNDGESFFGISPDDIPGWCGDIQAMKRCCSTVARVAGGATRIMLHVGLHAVKSNGQFRADEISFDQLKPWQDWLQEELDADVDTWVSFDFTLWGGPENDGLTLGSPNRNRRAFFERHCISSMTAMIELATRINKGRPSPAKIPSNVWLSDFASRVPADGTAIKRQIRESMGRIFGSANWRPYIDFSQEGKAPPTQRATWMGVTNYDALQLAYWLHQRWCLDDGHGYPTEPMWLGVDTARASDIGLAAHATLSESGADDDKMLGTKGHPLAFMLALSRPGCSRDATTSSAVLMQARMASLADVTIGNDMFETGIPPELAMTQGIMADRMNTITALLTPIDLSLAASASGDPCERALALMADDNVTNAVDLPNCLYYWRLEHGLDPNWAGLALEGFQQRVS